MNDLQLADEILERIRGLDGRYHERAYLFVLAALEYGQRRRPERGHMSGQELAWACYDFAVEQFGLTARTVLHHWGLHTTEDLGRIVFILIEIGLFMKDGSDRIEDFDAVYDFAEAFDTSYPWAGVSQAQR